MAYDAEVTAGTYGHNLQLEMDIDLTIDTPTLKVIFRSPDESTEYERSATIDPADPTSKTILYTTVAGDLGVENDPTTWGEYRAIGKADYGSNGMHKGRPALRIYAADPWS